MDPAIGIEQPKRNLARAELLGETREVFPMDCTAAVCQETCASKDVRAGAEASYRNTALAAFAQPGIEKPVRVFLNMMTGADQGHERPLHAGKSCSFGGDGTVHIKAQAAAGAHLAAVSRRKAPFIHVFAQSLVCETKHLNSRGKGEHCEIRHEIENKQMSSLLQPVHVSSPDGVPDGAASVTFFEVLTQRTQMQRMSATFGRYK